MRNKEEIKELLERAKESSDGSIAIRRGSKYWHSAEILEDRGVLKVREEQEGMVVFRVTDSGYENWAEDIGKRLMGISPIEALKFAIAIGAGVPGI